MGRQGTKAVETKNIDGQKRQRRKQTEKKHVELNCGDSKAGGEPLSVHQDRPWAEGED